MKTLWDTSPEKRKKGTGQAPDRTWFFRFTAEEDRELDRHLVTCDILVNIAQARMLRKIGVYDEKGYEKVLKALLKAWKLADKGSFDLGPDDEDVHSAVENYLTDKAGEEGARIHTGRSRNDQVLADIRLFMKEAALDIAGEWIAVARRLEELATSYNGVFFAGMTHTQPAMPHSVDAWASGYLDLLLSDMRALQEAFGLIDQSPLGSAAGYGVPYIRIDREYVSQQLGFAKVQEPVAAAQLSRGRFEIQMVDALTYGALTFNRMASDVVWFMHPSWSLVRLHEDQTSGSSIMPQKRNPDAWELIRAAFHELQSLRIHLATLPANLVSGYHRDLQAVKKSVMEALFQSKKLAEAVRYALAGLEFDKEAAERSLTPEVFATHKANKLVADGVPFREAYRKVAREYRSGEEGPDRFSPAMMGPGEPRSGEKGQRQKPGQAVSGGGEEDRTSLMKEAGAGSYHHTGAPGAGIPSGLQEEISISTQWVTDRKKQWERIKKDLLS